MHLKKAIIPFYTLPVELKEVCSLNVKLESSTWRWVVIISGVCPTYCGAKHLNGASS